MRTMDRPARGGVSERVIPSRIFDLGKLAVRRGKRPEPGARAGHAESPIRWARRGAISRGIAAAIPPRSPAVLVLSLPRSGSSWVGDTLGRAADALYLREPVTQSEPAFYRLGTVFHVDRAKVEDAYGTLADKAFLGWPDFDHTIVRFPERWGLRRRLASRVVVKEVNPLACGWYLGRYRPRVIHLVRHPAAVALSNQKKGWLRPEADAWARYGEFQALAIREQAEALAGHPAGAIVTYEDLCADPLRVFERLFAFAGLTWDDTIRATIRADSAGSAGRIGAWRDEVPRRTIEALRRGFGGVGLPWYRDDQDW